MNRIAKGNMYFKDLLEENRFGKIGFEFEGRDEQTGEIISETLFFNGDPRIYLGEDRLPADPAEFQGAHTTGRVMYSAFEYKGRTCYKVHAVQVCPIDEEALLNNPFAGY